MKEFLMKHPFVSLIALLAILEFIYVTLGMLN